MRRSFGQKQLKTTKRSQRSVRIKFEKQYNLGNPDFLYQRIQVLNKFILFQNVRLGIQSLSQNYCRYNVIFYRDVRGNKSSNSRVCRLRVKVNTTCNILGNKEMEYYLGTAIPRLT